MSAGHGRRFDKPQHLLGVAARVVHESSGIKIRFCCAQHQSSTTDFVPEVSTRRQHAPRQEHHHNDADVRELRPYVGHRIQVATP